MIDIQEPAIVLRGVSMDYPLPPRHEAVEDSQSETLSLGGRLREFRSRQFVRSLDELSLEIKNGERLAILGSNGSGKSTLLKVMGGLLPISQGTLERRGRVTTLFNTSVGLDVNLSGYDNLDRLSALYGLPASHSARIHDDVAEFTELGSFLKLPVKTYSAGMRARLGFAFVTSLPSDIMLIDEVIGVGDASFTRKARERLVERMHGSGIVVLASHSVALLRDFCTRGLILHRGKMEYLGDINEAISRYQAFIQRRMAGRPTPGALAKISVHRPTDVVVPPVPAPIEQYVKPGQNFDVFVTSTRQHSSAIKEHLASRASIAAFEFSDEAGILLKGTHPGFITGIADPNFLYVPGGRVPASKRHTRFLVNVPDNAHHMRVTIKPATDLFQTLEAFNIRQVHAAGDTDETLPVGRGAIIETVISLIKNGDWQRAGSNLTEMLSWPIGEIGEADLRLLEQALIAIPTGRGAAALPVLRSVLKDEKTLPKTGISDRIALAFLWELAGHYFLTGDTVYLDEMEACSDRLLAALGEFSAPLIAQGILATYRGDRAVANEKFNRAAEVESFDAPVARMFSAVYSVPDAMAVADWADSVLSNADEVTPPGTELEWISAPLQSSDKPVVLFSADGRTFINRAEAVLAELDRFGSTCSVHFHVVNWTAECSALRQMLEGGRARELGFTAEARGEIHDRSYPNVAAYLRAREIMEATGSAIITADIHAPIARDPTLLMDILGLKDYGFDMPNLRAPLPWLSPLSFPAVFQSSEVSKAFLRAVESYIRRFHVSDYPLTIRFEQIALNDAIYLFENG